MPASSSTPDYLSSNPETPQITTYTQDSTLERDYEEITELNVPDVVGYTTAVEKGHIARVRSEEKDLYSVVFSNGDGTNTLYMFSDPVKFIDKDGKVRNKSNKIVPADGSSNNG
ncbi:MAG: hypothetical protein PHY15_02720 [Eubacteriales bacterium]|nr:hypothetical protein [Eubacteriales bacterium]MDD4474887.1 hypothetical protein [Eubacteriales bacterium]